MAGRRYADKLPVAFEPESSFFLKFATMPFLIVDHFKDYKSNEPGVSEINLTSPAPAP
jgi:hypothetical protein